MQLTGWDNGNGMRNAPCIDSKFLLMDTRVHFLYCVEVTYNYIQLLVSQVFFVISFYMQYSKWVQQLIILFLVGDDLFPQIS